MIRKISTFQWLMSLLDTIVCRLWITCIVLLKWSRKLSGFLTNAEVAGKKLDERRCARWSLNTRPYYFCPLSVTGRESANNEPTLQARRQALRPLQATDQRLGIIPLLISPSIHTGQEGEFLSAIHDKRLVSINLELFNELSHSLECATSNKLAKLLPIHIDHWLTNENFHFQVDRADTSVLLLGLFNYPPLVMKHV